MCVCVHGLESLTVSPCLDNEIAFIGQQLSSSTFFRLFQWLRQRSQDGTVSRRKDEINSLILIRFQEINNWQKEESLSTQLLLLSVLIITVNCCIK